MKPTPNSTYKYRRVAYIDIMNFKANVPIYEDAIYMKVLELPENAQSKQQKKKSTIKPL